MGAVSHKVVTPMGNNGWWLYGSSRSDHFTSSITSASLWAKGISRRLTVVLSYPCSLPRTRSTSLHSLPLG